MDELWHNCGRHGAGNGYHERDYKVTLVFETKEFILIVQKQEYFIIQLEKWAVPTSVRPC